MKVYTHKELEELIPKVESELEKVLEEREKLGLSIPKDYQIFLNFYNAEGADATAQKTDKGSIISVNALKTVAYQFKGKEEEKLVKLANYFDITRTFLGHENWIFSIIHNPEETMKNFEQAFKSEKALQAYKEGFKTRGRTYEEYKQFASENAEPAKKALYELLPKIKDAFKKADLSLRHEIDHADFFNSQIYSDSYTKLKRSKELQYRLHTLGDKSVSKEYAKANMETLKSKIETEPIIEPRAFFFDYIKPDEWDKTNYEEVKKKIFGKFLLYIEHVFPRDILDTLVSQKWSKGEMDTATSMFLFYTVNNQMQSANSAAYVVQPEKVNYKTANQILFKEIPEWKLKLAKNAEKTIEAIGQAYKEKPSRLKQANEAKTFEEFINTCKG